MSGTHLIPDNRKTFSPPLYIQQCHVDLIKQTPALRRLGSHNTYSIEQMKGVWWSNSLNAEARGETSLSNLNNSTCWTLNNQPQRRGCYTLRPSTILPSSSWVEATVIIMLQYENAFYV